MPLPVRDVGLGFPDQPGKRYRAGPAGGMSEAAFGRFFRGYFDGFVASSILCGSTSGTIVTGVVNLNGTFTPES